INDGGDGLGFVAAFGTDGQEHPLTGGQHHHSHDALRIDFAVVVEQPHAGFKFLYQLDQFGRSTGM
ncbi:hypothetical protein RF55_22647, partial [Lasius niger]